MSLEIKQLPKSEIEITGEIPASDFSLFWQKAIKELSKGVSLPGFRPGKIPEKVLIEKIGEGSVLEKSAEMALQEEYPKILKEKKIEAVGFPKTSITKIAKGEALGFKFQTAVLPEMKLPEDYKEISSKVAKKKEEVKVEDKEVDASIEYLRKMKAKQNSSEDSEEAVLPELNDEFAKSFGGEFNTMDDLKKSIKENMILEKEGKLKEKKRLEILDAILKKTELELPDVLIEGEKNKMLQELKANITSMGMKWEDYLTQVKKTEKELLEGWGEDAVRRVKYGLILRYFGKELDIKITGEEISQKAKEMGFDVEDEGSLKARGIDKQRIMDYAEGIIRNEKVFTYLEKC